GGKGRRALAGRGATPPAHMRHWYKAKYGTAASPQKTTARQTRAKRGEDAPEIVSGRNPVVEALRGGVPASALYVAQRIDNDERVREAIQTAADRGIPL